MEADWISEALRSVIWRRRAAFYGAAVMRGIISAEQMEALYLLHLERDAAQDEREEGSHGSP